MVVGKRPYILCGKRPNCFRTNTWVVCRFKTTRTEKARLRFYSVHTKRYLLIKALSRPFQIENYSIMVSLAVNHTYLASLLTLLMRVESYNVVAILALRKIFHYCKTFLIFSCKVYAYNFTTQDTLMT